MASLLALTVGGLFEAADRREELRTAGVPDEVIDQAGIGGATWANVVLLAAWGGTILYALYLNPDYQSWRWWRRQQSDLQFSTTHAQVGQQAGAWPPPPPQRKPRVVPFINWRGTVNVHEQNVQAGGDVNGVHGGTVSQQGSVSGLPIEVVVALMAQYRAALIEMDPGSRQEAELVLASLDRAISLPHPDTDAASRHLETLKMIAQRAAVSAAAGAGAKLLWSLLESWPF